MTIYKKEKIAFASSHPIQYQVPIFKRISKKKILFMQFLDVKLIVPQKCLIKNLKKILPGAKIFKKVLILFHLIKTIHI